MSNGDRPQDFAERLRRIEEKHGTAPREVVQPSRPTSNYGVPEKENHGLRNGIIWAFIIAAVGAGGYYGVKAIPEDLTQTIAGLRSSSSDDGAAPRTTSMVSMASSTPGVPETETMSDQGPVIASPMVVQAGAEPVTLTEVVASPDLTTGDTIVGQIVPFARNAQCDLRNPLPSEKVLNVRIRNALLTAPIQAFSNTHLANRILGNVGTVTRQGEDYDFESLTSGQKTSLDVFITDASAPIYLVLQNMGAGVIWNVHTAPDVTLAHVAIVASDHSGLVDPPNSATFEALLVKDFVEPHRFGLDDEIRECMIRPWRNPQPDWTGSIKAERGNFLYENQMESYAKGYIAYNSWFTQTLGVDASTNLVTARDAAHVLIGPMPSEPIAYTSMAGKDIHMMNTDNMFTGDTATRQATNADLHKDLLLAAIGGDVSALNPAPMERPAQ